MSGSSSLTMLPVLLLLSTDVVQAGVIPLLSTSSLPSVSPSSSPLTCSVAATGLRPDLLWFRDGERLSGGERSQLGGEMTDLSLEILAVARQEDHSALSSLNTNTE